MYWGLDQLETQKKREKNEKKVSSSADHIICQKHDKNVQSLSLSDIQVFKISL